MKKQSLCLLLVPLLIIGLLPLVTVELAQAAPEEWWNENWSYSKRITIDNAKVEGEDHDNFPVLVYLSSDGDLAAHAMDNGDDIAFVNSDNTVQYDHEVEYFDGDNGMLVAHIRIPTLYNATDTVFYMYYGNAGASDQQNPTGVWEDNFIMVQHMTDITTSTTEDSTSYNNDGTKYAANEPIEVGGKIWKAQDVDGVNDYINCENDSSLNFTGDLSIEAWIKTTDGVQYKLIVSRHYTTGYTLGLNADALNSGHVSFWTSTSSWVVGNTSIRDDVWHYVVLVLDGTTARFYVDGTPDGTQTSAAPPSTTQNFAIGSRSDGTYNINALLDEVRISEGTRSAGWILTTYNNQSSPPTFYTVGVEETSIPGGPNSPTALLCEGLTNPIRILDLTPEFSAIGIDPEADQMDKYALQVDDASGFGSPIWNQTKTSITAFNSGTRCGDITYAGPALSRGVTYYWRIKFWDVDGNEGNWSIVTATFEINQLPTLPTGWTDLGVCWTAYSPNITWAKGTDADGDTVTTFIYLGTTSTPTEVDGSTTGETFDLGENTSHSTYPLTKGSTYYYRLRSWDGYEWSTGYTTADEFEMGYGSGTVGDPFIITTDIQLQTMKENLAAYYVLGNDITMTHYQTGSGFEPVGTATGYFTGSLDGKKHKIINLFISVGDVANTGLFGWIGDGGVVKNVGLENVALGSLASTFGAFVGRNYGTIDNCYSTGYIISDWDHQGGFVGINNGTISNCYSRCTVNGGGISWFLGGFVGTNNGTISKCYSTGAVYGGWISGGCIFGFAGQNTATISDSFWDVETSGHGTSAGATGKTTENMKDNRTFTDPAWSAGLTSPWDFWGNPYDDTGTLDIWDMYGEINDGYPFHGVYMILTMQSPTDGDVSPTPGAHTYRTGAVVPISATPHVTHTFIEWIVDGLSYSTDASDSITMDTDHTVLADFNSPPSYDWVILLIRFLFILGPLAVAAWTFTKIRDPVAGLRAAGTAAICFVAIMILWFIADAIEEVILAL